MTPPSTFQMAPVTQLVAGDSKKVMVLARSRTVPGLPERMKPVEAAPMAWSSPHPADVHDPPAPAPGHHAAGHGLGEKEDGPVQFQVGVVGGAVGVQERGGDEQPGRVDQQGRVGVLGGQLLADGFGLHPVGQVGGDPVRGAVGTARRVGCRSRRPW